MALFLDLLNCFREEADAVSTLVINTCGWVEGFLFHSILFPSLQFLVVLEHLPSILCKFQGRVWKYWILLWRSRVLISSLTYKVLIDLTIM